VVGFAHYQLPKPDGAVKEKDAPKFIVFTPVLEVL
jgi:hypothetical protein